MPSRQCLLATLLLLGCSNAVAGVYKCTVNGQTVFQDIACTKPTAAATPPAAPALPRVTVPVPVNLPVTAPPPMPSNGLADLDSPQGLEYRIVALKARIADLERPPYDPPPTTSPFEAFQTDAQRAMAQAATREAAGFHSVAEANSELLRLQQRQEQQRQAGGARQDASPEQQLANHIIALETHRRQQLLSMGCDPGIRLDLAVASKELKARYSAEDSKSTGASPYSKPDADQLVQCQRITDDVSARIEADYRQLDIVRLRQQSR